MSDITVPVPDERVAEFYQFFGLWLAGALSLSQIATDGSQDISGAIASPAKPVVPWGDSPEDAADAEFLWRKFSTNARNFFGYLMDNAPEKYTGEHIAQAVGIPNGAHGVAGVLAWPGRFCAPIGRWLPSSWKEDAETEESYYWMEEDVADLFKSARERVESG